LTASADSLIHGITIGRGGSGVSNNTALGYNALNAITTGGTNVAVGYEAGLSLTDASDTTFIGYQAGRLATGGENTAVGTQAMQNVIYSGGNGVGNVAIGYWALRGTSAQSPTSNIAIGNSAGRLLSTGGNYNVLVGGASGDALTTGYSNIAMGSNSLGSGTTTSSNVALGHSALSAITTSGDNTAIGRNAGTVATGSNNTFAGSGAGDAQTSGNNNIILGYNADGSSTTVSNEITLGNTSVTKFRIPGINFTVKDTVATEDYVLTVDASGEAGWEAAAGGGTTYTIVSSGNSIAAGTYIDISGYSHIKCWFTADSANSNSTGPKLSTSGVSNLGVSTAYGRFHRRSPTGATLPYYSGETAAFSPATSALYYGANSAAADNKLYTLEMWGLDQSNVMIETSARFIATYQLMWNSWSGTTTTGSATWFLYVDIPILQYQILGAS
jgi:hypothetical protein